MIKCSDKEIEWLEFEIFSECPRLKHAVLLRKGGCSVGPFASLNLAAHVGDFQEHVSFNRIKVAKLFNLSLILYLQQCHGKDIIEIHSNNTNLIHTCDSMVTAVPHLGLMIQNGDCQAAIIYDPVHHVVANVHAGWRGSVQNIYQETLTFMHAKYRSSPSDLLVGISPSLGPMNGEFVNYREELPESFWDFQTKPKYFNFWEISRWQLRNCGILDHHLQISQIDTFSNPEDYFSYRREKITGRNGVLVSLLQ
jgi:YfiH family protein